MQDEHPLTLRHVEERLIEMHGHREVVTLSGDAAGRLSYAELVGRSRRLRHALGVLGVGSGDRVGTLAWNTHRHLELYLAVPCHGAVLHTINARLFEDDLAYVIEQAGDRVLFVDPELLPTIRPCLERVSCVEHLVVLGAAAGGALEYEALLSGQPEDVSGGPLDERQAAGLCFTSGTTGRPKGVLYSHRSMLLHALGQCLADGVGVRASDRVMPLAPMFHVNGWGLPYSAALAGADLVLPGPDMRPSAVIDAIAGERVTLAAAVPTVWTDVLTELDREPRRLESLRLVLTGGAPVPRALMQALEERHGLVVVQSWGMTESLSVNLVSHPPHDAEGEARWGYRCTAGRLQPLVEARVIDDDGRELPRDGRSAGHLQIRGPLVADRYFAAGGSEERFAGSWLPTGDVATIDERGYVRIVDRSKDLIKSGGEWIASAELEGHLAAHPEVAATAVVARADARWGERPVAYVVATAPRAGLEADLRAHLEGRVARWWIPDAIVFVESLPTTGVGKIDKRALRRAAAEGGGA